MLQKYLLTSLVVCVICTLTFGQKSQLTEETLELWASQMVNDSIEHRRVAFSDSLKTALIVLLGQSKSRSQKFDALKSVAVTTALDDRFRIFSWQVFLSESQYKHEGIIQFLKEDRDLVILNDQSDHIYNPHKKSLRPEEWYGALYYRIVPFKSKKTTQYLLFGFDSSTGSENTKIVDVLAIDKNGNLEFGAPIFNFITQNVSQTFHRHFHQYDQNAKAVLRYDPSLEMIIFDNLIPWQSKEVGGKLTYVPDGSYQGYILKKGEWHLVDKIFDHVSASPAGPDNPLGKKIEDNLPK